VRKVREAQFSSLIHVFFSIYLLYLLRLQVDPAADFLYNGEKFSSQTPMGTQAELDKVHALYVMQMDLWKILDGRVRSEAQLQEARRQLREFSKLLKEVDWRYMGGEDVYQTLEQVSLEADRKLRTKMEKQRVPVKKRGK